MTISTGEHAGWLEISIRINPIAHESLNAFLFDLGCTGIAFENFNDHTLKAYLPSHKNLEDIRNRINIFLQNLKKIFPELQSHKLTLKRIKDRDWSVEWHRFFHPDRITPRLMVFPAWEPVPSSTDDHVIRIDPGPAFGTGLHPTTRMCLEALEKLMKRGSQSLLDVGTGSGILAIYGAKLGAKGVKAIDIDPEALRWAKHNIELNDLSGQIVLSSETLDQLKGPFSLLTANLILGEIIKRFSHFPRLLSAGGGLILSGILREQVKEVREILRSYPFREYDILYQKEWACIIATRLVNEKNSQLCY